jgi:hypothetical protein
VEDNGPKIPPSLGLRQWVAWRKAFAVIPVKTGIQVLQELLDPGFRRGDDI